MTEKQSRMTADIEYIRGRAKKDLYQDTDYPQMVLRLLEYIDELQAKAKKREKRKERGV